MFPSVEALLEYITKNEVKLIDYRFTDLLGKWHHVTYDASSVDASTFSYGVPFDGSSIPGWRPIERSDMILMPDISTAFLDPFFAQQSLVIVCDVVDTHGSSRYSGDPRYTAKKACEYMASLSIADKCLFGTELEFFVFDSANFAMGPYGGHFKLGTQESDSTKTKGFCANHGYSIQPKGGYLGALHMDSAHDMRSEMLSMFSEVGIAPLMHHHEVASSQCEVGFQHAELVSSADNVQKCKYVLRSVAATYGKSVTFMPKPVMADNGNGMHCHQSLWSGGTNLFAGGNRGISETCIHYIGGIIKHGRALNAFTNPSTNSYKRLVPNFEAPVHLVYSHENRSAAIRIPYTDDRNTSARRIEVRFPDPLANPYLCFAAQLMAGLDGIKNKMRPEEVSKSLYDVNEAESCKFTPVAASLEEALESLKSDKEFLLKGGVFTEDQIDSYIKLKEREVTDLRTCPHPVEFVNYYGL